MSKVIQHISNFEEYLKLITESSCIVKFTAIWCGPCKRIAPLYERLAAAYSEKVNFLEVDIDYADPITNHENVTSIPLFLFYHKGEKLENLTVGGYNELLLAMNTKAFVAKLTEPKKEIVIITPLSTSQSDSSEKTLVLDDVQESDDSDKEVKESEEPCENEYDVPIEKTIPDNMIKENN